MEQQLVLVYLSEEVEELQRHVGQLLVELEHLFVEQQFVHLVYLSEEAEE